MTGAPCMSLAYKDDWEEAKERLLAWWQGETIGRCAMAVTAPRKSLAGPAPPPPRTPQQRWTDLDYMAEAGAHRNAATFFGGEASPVWDASYPGNRGLPSFLGCPITLDFETGWHEPILTGEDIDCDGLQLDEAHPSWLFAMAWAERGAREAAGKCLAPIGFTGGCGDTLASLRGTERLLVDLVERPDQVRRADQHLMGLWRQAYDRFHEVTREATDGSTCWFRLWSPGRFYAAQNDFSYMISPAMFRDVFIPTLEAQTEFLDHSVYHVDGIAAFAHVDALCELPRLGALQILPGAGKPSPLHYIPVLKKVQAKGKNLHITIPPEEVEDALSELSARGLFIETWAADEEQARDLLRKAEAWSKSQ